MLITRGFGAYGVLTIRGLNDYLRNFKIQEIIFYKSKIDILIRFKVELRNN